MATHHAAKLTIGSFFTGLFYSMPVQLLLLHLRRYQILLLPWIILFATVGGAFMQKFGASSLFLAPEYMGAVTWLSTAIAGFAFGLFVMSWNITHFILNGQYFPFLATTAQPFVKFCINNALLPLLFLGWYLFYAWRYGRVEELIGQGELLLLVGGFVLGTTLGILLLIYYFYHADIRIYRSMATLIDMANLRYFLSVKEMVLPVQAPQSLVRVHWFLSARLGLRKPRDVRHYSTEIIDTVFKRHHQAGALLILLSLAALLVLGFFLDNEVFQFPAAASILVLFAILLALSGAISLFFRSWSILFGLGLYLLLNTLYQNHFIDGRNRAYGLLYHVPRASYTQPALRTMQQPQGVRADSIAFIARLNAWKLRQPAARPVMVLLNVSGGGSRSAVFTTQMLQAIDDSLQGRFMQHTALISGASGGMLGAAWYRAVYEHLGPGGTSQPWVVESIGNDLLNPIFSSFVSRDMSGSIRKFSYQGQRYPRDRGYAFEEKLNSYTRGWLNVPLGHYLPLEDSGRLPTLLVNPVIVADGRKLVTATRPMRFMCRPIHTAGEWPEPDGVDFQTLFARQQAPQLRMLTALRMNASFPYVLPNVWLPTEPVIDVMDAGLRDNYGEETSLRFLAYFKQWMQQNLSAVIIVQLKDRASGEWNAKAFAPASIFSFFSKPLGTLQQNLFTLQQYQQADALSYLQPSAPGQLAVHKLNFEYRSVRPEKHAGMSFHLTAAEKKDIAASVDNPANKAALQQLIQLVKTPR